MTTTATAQGSTDAGEAGKTGTTDTGTAGSTTTTTATAVAAGAGTTTGTTDGAKGTTSEGEKGSSTTTSVSSSEFSIKFPEGVGKEAQEAFLKDFKPLAESLGVKGEGAQKLAEAHFKQQQSWVDASQKHWADTQAGWVDATKKDPEIGGAKFEKTMVAADRALSKFGTPALKEFLAGGIGKHPEWVRLMAKVGGALGEDSQVGTHGTGATAAPQNADEALMRSLYPTMQKG